MQIIIAFTLSACAASVTPPDPPLRSPVISPQTARLMRDSGANAVSAWVLFTDKGLSDRADSDAAITSLAPNYPPRALQRRGLRRTVPGLFDERDLPVFAAYIAAVENTGAQLRVVTKWANGISVRASSAQLDEIARLPFVRTITPVRRSATIKPEPSPFSSHATPTRDFYGLASAQLNQINIPAAHAAGYTGTGVVIGVLDTGFHRSHEAYNQPGHVLAVLAEHDYVADDGNTQIQAGDDAAQHSHGTRVLSTIGGYNPNTFVGGAYNAEFILVKTEDITQEVPAEEDQYVAGLEFIEMNGGDLATSSLGYIDWYSQNDLDGETAVTTIAVNTATDNGLVCVTAAGNGGHDFNPTTSALIAPADAFEVLTCGAVDEFGEMASFSSDGPTADGRAKPELLARGYATASIDAYNDAGYSEVYGTSFATPLVAAAAALVLDAHPDWTVTRVRSALLRTAGDFVANGDFDPMFVRGYGILDVMAAINFAFPTGDADGDGDIDLADVAQMQACFAGPRVAAPAGCALTDLDSDEDVDPADFRIVQPAISGPQ